MTLIRRSNAKAFNKITHFVPLPLLRASYGAVLATGSPLGWILLQWLDGRNPFSPDRVDPLLYVYLTLTTMVVFACLGYAIGQREQAITELAFKDSLTALYNMRYFKNRLEQEFERHLRHGAPLAIIQIDLDFFKDVNDTWGHQAGDAVLKSVSSVIMSNCRKSEIAARVGGEEMCIIACDCSDDAAMHLAERLRVAIKNSSSNWQGHAIKITASFGVAIADSNTVTAWQVYQHADDAMYQAKQTGRNKVCRYQA